MQVVSELPLASLALSECGRSSPVGPVELEAVELRQRLRQATTENSRLKAEVDCLQSTFEEERHRVSAGLSASLETQRGWAAVQDENLELRSRLSVVEKQVNQLREMHTSERSAARIAAERAAKAEEALAAARAALAEAECRGEWRSRRAQDCQDQLDKASGAVVGLEEENHALRLEATSARGRWRQLEGLLATEVEHRAGLVRNHEDRFALYDRRLAEAGAQIAALEAAEARVADELKQLAFAKEQIGVLTTKLAEERESAVGELGRREEELRQQAGELWAASEREAALARELQSLRENHHRSREEEAAASAEWLRREQRLTSELEDVQQSLALHSRLTRDHEERVLQLEALQKENDSLAENCSSLEAKLRTAERSRDEQKTLLDTKVKELQGRDGRLSELALELRALRPRADDVAAQEALRTQLDAALGGGEEPRAALDAGQREAAVLWEQLTALRREQALLQEAADGAAELARSEHGRQAETIRKLRADLGSTEERFGSTEVLERCLALKDQQLCELRVDVERLTLRLHADAEATGRFQKSREDMEQHFEALALENGRLAAELSRQRGAAEACYSEDDANSLRGRLHGQPPAPVPVQDPDSPDGRATPGASDGGGDGGGLLRQGSAASFLGPTSSSFVVTAPRPSSPSAEDPNVRSSWPTSSSASAGQRYDLTSAEPPGQASSGAKSRKVTVDLLGL